MAELVAFESSRKKDAIRKQLREDRERILEKAKQDHERREQKKKEVEAAGQGSWVLDSVAQRISCEQAEINEALTRKTEDSGRKKKKKKKEKKSKKRKKTKSTKNSDSDSGSSDESNDEMVWAEKPSANESSRNNDSNVRTAPIGPKLERDSWMLGDDDSFVPTLTRDEIRRKVTGKTQEQEQAEKEARDAVEKPGSHARELNPFWKDGGSGLPSASGPGREKGSGGLIGDGGLSFYKKALQRCKETAQESGRSVEEVAAERYGSLDELKAKIAEAEKLLDQERGTRTSDTRSRGDDRYGNRGNRSGYQGNRSGYHDNRADSRRQDSRYSDNSRRPAFRRPDDDDNKINSDNKRDGDRLESSRPAFRRPDDNLSSRSTDESSARRERFIQPEDGGSSAMRKRAFMKPSEDDASASSSRTVSKDDGGKFSEELSRKRKFLNPMDSADNESKKDERFTESRYKREETRNDRVPAWKKTSYIQTSDKQKEEARRRSSSGSSRSSSDSDSDSSNSSSDSRSSHKRPSKSGQGQDKKLDQDDDKKLGKGEDRVSEEGEGSEDEEVLLSRTDRGGMTRPVVLSGEGETRGGGKKRRKKDKVTTHTGDGGRERYFADDDQYDLKTLVEREKLSTAEDQNQMFARLAGRAVDKTDDDFAIDDMFVDRAANKQSKSYIDSREKQIAIIEHKRMKAAVDKCTHCFNNVPKHLIIAIGVKVYVCVPAHRSMSEGHCLIIPMQHVSQSTVCDEDVWDEIKTFRKCLTRMFADRGDDCVFMETCMKLYKCPHLVIECVPVNKETGDMAPLYFKKAISECEKEWSDNKKLVDLKGRDIRRAVPRGFPYFTVDFGMDGGYAHVIEDEKSFPWYFGREVVGGMLDLDPTLWRHPHKEHFEQQRRKVLSFSDMWKPYDWTISLGGRSQALASTNQSKDNGDAGKGAESLEDTAANSSKDNKTGGRSYGNVRTNENTGGRGYDKESANERKRKTDNTVTGSSETANESAAAKLKAALFGFK